METAVKIKTGDRVKAQELFQRVANNLKNISNSRLAVLVAIFIPLILVLLFGIAFNQQTTMTMKVGYFFSQEDNTSLTFKKAFTDHEFVTIALLSEQGCINSVKYGLTHACLSFPESNTSTSAPINIYMSSENIPYISSLMKSFVATGGISLSSGDVKLNLLNEVGSLNGELDKQKKQVEEAKNVLKTVQDEIKTSSGSSSSAGTTSTDGTVTVQPIDFSTSKDQLLKDVEDMNAIAVKSLKKISDKLEDIEDEVKSSDLESNEKDDINELLSDANDVLKEVRTDVNTQSGLVNTSMSALLSDINKAQSAITYASGKTQPGNTGLSPQLISIQQRLEGIAAQLTAITDTITIVEGIVTNLENTPDSSPLQKSSSTLKSIENTDATASLLGVYIFVLILVTILLTTHLVHERRYDVDLFKTPQIFYDAIIEFLSTAFVFNLVVSIFMFVLFSLFVTKTFIAHFHLSILPILLITGVFSALGIMIGMVVRDLEASVFVSIVVFSLIAFFSDTILKYSNEIIVTIKQFNPYVISQNFMMSVVLFGASFSQVKTQMLYLVGFFAGGVAILLVMLHKYKDKFSSSPHKDEHGNEIEYEDENHKSHDKNTAEADDDKEAGSAEDVIKKLEEIGSHEHSGEDDVVNTGDLSVEEYKHLQSLVKKAGKKVEKLIEAKESKTDAEKEAKHKDDKKEDKKHATADHLVERLKIEAEIVELVKKKDYSKKELKKKLLEQFTEDDIDAVFEEVFK